jgi:hypothetical protein
MFNSHIRGWINYYGRFCPSALYPTLQHIDLILARWAACGATIWIGKAVNQDWKEQSRQNDD